MAERGFYIYFTDPNGDYHEWRVMGHSQEDVERRFKAGEYLDEGDDYIPEDTEQANAWFAKCEVERVEAE